MPSRAFSFIRSVVRLLLAGGLIAFPAVSHAASAKPVTVQELCLLFHGGYTGGEVLKETAGRPLLEPLDASAEKTLLAAGADASFINALRASHPTLTDAEAGAARQQQADAATRDADGRAAYIGRMREANQASFEAHQAARKQDALGRVAAQFKGKLVFLRDDGLQPFSKDALAQKKLFAFYFAAARSVPSRDFTPALVKFYQDFAPKHAAFEVIFFSADRSAAEMESDMRQNAMPWPALAFDRRADEPSLMKAVEAGLPRLLLIDGMGRPVSDSFVDGKYVGPQHVLDDLAKLDAAGSR